MNTTVNAIANRLSLRQPQRDSLEILADICELLALDRVVSGAQETDVAKALETIKAKFPSVSDFERDFASVCFALATGVGKTRLMGAFITYLLRQTHPSLLRARSKPDDLQQAHLRLHARYARSTSSEGIADFVIQPPEIITGDNYESGRGVRERRSPTRAKDRHAPVHINIFNISKINYEVRGGTEPAHQAPAGVHRRELLRVPGRVG